MKNVINLGFWLGLAVWTFIIGGFYGLINFGGDFVQWLNAALLGLAPHHFNTLVDALQSAGFFICAVLWVIGVAVLYFMRHAGVRIFGAGLRGGQNPNVDRPTINSTAREL